MARGLGAVHRRCHLRPDQPGAPGGRCPVSADRLASRTVTGMASAQQPRHFSLPGSIAADCFCAFRPSLP
jgi:hypothetical protein